MLIHMCFRTNDIIQNMIHEYLDASVAFMTKSLYRENPQLFLRMACPPITRAVQLRPECISVLAPVRFITSAVVFFNVVHWGGLGGGMHKHRLYLKSLFGTNIQHTACAHLFKKTDGCHISDAFPLGHLLPNTSWHRERYYNTVQYCTHMHLFVAHELFISFITIY